MMRLMRRNDFPPLSLSMLLSLVLLGLGAALLRYAWQTKAASEEELRQASAGQQAAATRLAGAAEDIQEILDKWQIYQALAARGIIGEERRQDWMDALAASRKQRRLSELQYEFAPQQSLGGTGRYQIMSSTMTIQLQLVHEEDLLGLVDDLSQQVQAHLRVRACAIQRRPAEVSPALNANCQIDWITLREEP